MGGENPVTVVLGRYRGCAVLGPPAHQALERAVLAEIGWPLLRSKRRALDLGNGNFRLETEHAGIWEADVFEGRHVPQPECRTGAALATKHSVEWSVEGLRRVSPA
jgi:hypothetical protein